MDPRLSRRLVWLIVPIILAVSVVALKYASWLRGIEEANRALESGNLTVALQGYEQANRAIALLPFPARSLPTGYRQIIYNRALALYLAQRYDEMCKAAQAIARTLTWDATVDAAEAVLKREVSRRTA